MTPYRVEFIWIENDMYLVKIYTKDEKVLIQEYVLKECIPELMSMYLCVGAYSV